jgi:hypothetical protein
MTTGKIALIGLLIWLLCSTLVASGQTTAFTYQGKLMNNGTLANGSYDFTMVLWDAQTNGAAIGSPVIRLNTPVVDGIFTVQLDFGVAAFNGSARYLEILVKPSGNPAILPTQLSPRQLVTSTPYAIKSLGAMSADSLSINCVNCITSSQIQSVQGSQVTGNIDGSQINGTIPVASVPAGSPSYIQNGTAQQGASNFNISGTGKANIVDVTTQYNLGGSRILSNAGTNNLFAGVGAGAVNTGGQNAFFGTNAGQSNTTGVGNSFFGFLAGQASTTSNFNSFFGNLAGQVNTGHDNNFFGNSAGASNTAGSFNSFFGNLAGALNINGSFNSFFGNSAGKANNALYNSFFGYQAGTLNTIGEHNGFFGTFAGVDNSTGDNNAFFGYRAGSSNTTGSNNTLIGVNADYIAADPTGDNDTLLGANTHVNSGVSNGTAIGANASVTQSNSLILGSINGINGATADTSVGIGTTAPAFRFHIIDPSNAGLRVQINTAGGKVASFGDKGLFQIDATGVAGGRFLVNEVGFVGINTTTPARRLDVNGTVIIRQLGPTGSNPLCLNAVSEVASCSSSLRYKTDVQTFLGGFDIVNRLRPITFTWKDSGMHDLGFGAEEVEKVEPLLTFRNQQGEIEGVKYGQISAVLVNAIKEQQAQIEAQHQQLESQAKKIDLQNATIEALKQLVCHTNAQAEICKPAGPVISQKP